MSSMSEAPFSYTIKVGPQGNLLTCRAETYEEMIDAVADMKRIEQFILTGAILTTTIDPVQTAQEVLGATVIGTTETETAPQEVPAAAPVTASAGPEIQTDKYGAQYTYGLAEAPQLPDGRGYYVKKAWTSQKGKRLTAWVDPVKGPKPFPKGAVEAELIWI